MPLWCHSSGKLPPSLTALPPSGPAPPADPSPRPHRPPHDPLSRTSNYNSRNRTKPIKDRGSRQGLVHRAVSSLSRPPRSSPSLTHSGPQNLSLIHISEPRDGLL